jgi:hypothetical protein
MWKLTRLIRFACIPIAQAATDRCVKVSCSTILLALAALVRCIVGTVPTWLDGPCHACCLICISTCQQWSFCAFGLDLLTICHSLRCCAAFLLRSLPALEPMLLFLGNAVLASRLDHRGRLRRVHRFRRVHHRHIYNCNRHYNNVGDSHNN